jgi:hypothetical protein
MDITIPQKTAGALAESSSTSYYSFAFKLCGHIFEKQFAKFFSKSGTLQEKSGMDTIALPRDYVDGYIGNDVIKVCWYKYFHTWFLFRTDILPG